MSRKSTTLAYAAAILLVGIALGVLIGTTYSRRSPSEGLPASEIAQLMRKHMKNKAGLSTEQLGKIDPIIQQTAQQIETIHFDTMVEIGKVFKNYHQMIEGPGELSAEQKAKILQMEKDREARLLAARPAQPSANTTP
jgi:uncharacterized membrane-anchored protein YhcB (DUF1043 family)